MILFIQFAGVFFGTVSLEDAMWAKLFGMSFSVIVLSELVKWIWRCWNCKKEQISDRTARE